MAKVQLHGFCGQYSARTRIRSLKSQGDVGVTCEFEKQNISTAEIAPSPPFPQKNHLGEKWGVKGENQAHLLGFELGMEVNFDPRVWGPVDTPTRFSG